MPFRVFRHRRTALADSFKLYRRLFDHTRDAIIITDAACHILDLNPAFSELFGYSLDELEGQNANILFAVENRYPAHGFEQAGFFAAVDYRKKSDEVFQGETDRYDLKGSRGRTVGFLSLIRDISERMASLAELHREKEKFKVLVEGSPFGIVYIDAGGRYQYMNPKFGRMFGYTLDDIPTGDAWFRKAYPEENYRDQIISLWLTDLKAAPIGEVRPRTANVTCKDGTVKTIKFRPVSLANGDQIMTCEDITDAMLLEAKLQQAQKLEAIGTLAGGIAHDFNNLLMGIQGRISLMSVDLGPLHPHFEHLKSIEDYIRSATDLTQQLLGFARGGKYEVKPIDLNELVRNSAAMFGRTKKQIRIHPKFQDPSPVVEADLRQIKQVLLNIYVNAWQAMPNGGELNLETRIVELDPAYCEPHQVKAGRYAQVSITDNGPGMEDAVRQRIFDPFFTTKDRGRGTGLGLASAYGIIKNHNGLITVYSEKGRGTTFNIYLPISGTKVRCETSFSEKPVKGLETILLVDDEQMIIDVGQSMLQKLGYRVVTARGGKAAVEAIKRLGNEIDLIILDMIMPEMDGGKTFDCIREILPAAKVILSSGYALNEQAEMIMRRGCNGFIQKPFGLAELSQRVRDLLDKGY